MRHPALKRLRVTGESISINTSGKILIVPTADPDKQIGRNEYTLDTARNGTTPWRGAKRFSDPPDNLPGTLRILETDSSFYLLPTSESNKSKTLHAGYLKSVSATTLTTASHTLENVFMLKNEGSTEETVTIGMRVPDKINLENCTLSIYNVDHYDLIETPGFSLVSTSIGAINEMRFSRTVATGVTETLKIIVDYVSPGKSTIQLGNDQILGTGLQYMAYPWFLIYDPSAHEADYILLTEHPDFVQYVQNDVGEITRVIISPSSGLIYHRKFTFPNLTADGDSDTIPDMLESLKDFLQTQDFITDFYEKWVLSSGVVANDFSITADSIGIFPFAVSGGNRVMDAAGNGLTKVESVTTASGTVDIYDIKGKTEVRVRDKTGNNAGDCQVWDTVTTGNINESTWNRIYNADHIFTGDRVVENGLVRFKNYASNLRFYSYTNDWAYCGYMFGLGATGHLYQITSITTISADAIDFVITADNTVVSSVRIIRGAPSANFVFSSNTDHTYFFLRDADIKKFRFYLHGSTLIDTTTGSGFVSVPGQYVVGIAPSLGYIPFSTSPSANNLTCYQGATIPELGWEFGTKIPSKLSIGAILYTSQMYWEAEACTKFGATVVADASAYGGQAVEIRRPAGLQNYITVNAAANCTPNSPTTIYVRAKCTLADKMYLYAHSTAASRIIASSYPTLTLGVYAYYSLTFTPLTSDFGGAINFYMKNMCDTGTEYPITVDYVLIVPTGLIEKHAKRSLVSISSLKTMIKVQK